MTNHRWTDLATGPDAILQGCTDCPATRTITPTALAVEATVAEARRTIRALGRAAELERIDLSLWRPEPDKR